MTRACAGLPAEVCAWDCSGRVARSARSGAAKLNRILPIDDAQKRAQVYARNSSWARMPRWIFRGVELKQDIAASVSMSTMNRQVLLASRPRGAVTEADFRVVEAAM